MVGEGAVAAGGILRLLDLTDRRRSRSTERRDDRFDLTGVKSA
jgi:hypothetical protein